MTNLFPKAPTGQKDKKKEAEEPAQPAWVTTMAGLGIVLSIVALFFFKQYTDARKSTSGGSATTAQDEVM
jgi:hypothetical protein